MFRVVLYFAYHYKRVKYVYSISLFRIKRWQQEIIPSSDVRLASENENGDAVAEEEELLHGLFSTTFVSKKYAMKNVTKDIDDI